MPAEKRAESPAIAERWGNCALSTVVGYNAVSFLCKRGGGVLCLSGIQFFRAVGDL